MVTLANLLLGPKPDVKSIEGFEAAFKDLGRCAVAREMLCVTKADAMP